MTRRNTVLGVQIDTRQRRRGLVATCYLFLACITVAAVLAPKAWEAGTWTLYAAFAVNYLALGGYSRPGAPGLVKPFANKPPKTPSMESELLRINIESATGWQIPSAADQEVWKNDERELSRRNAVHYAAYQIVMPLMAVVYLLAMWSVHRPSFMPGRMLPLLLYGVALPALLLGLTLPQAILLWTEPDEAE